MENTVISTIEEDELYMRKALELAREAAADGEVPVGAVIVKDGKVISEGRNRREKSGLATAHAEIEAINSASESIGHWRLLGCTLYVTMEPCAMCAGAVINARIPRVVFGCYDKRFGAFGSTYSLNEGKLNHVPDITGGVLEDECITLLQNFFREKR